MVMRFGYIYYLIATICVIFSFLSAIHPVVGGLNALFQSCCVSIPGAALIIVVGVFRFSWSGSACSYPGGRLESQGLFLKNMFIAQIVLQGFFLCCAGSGTSVKRKDWDLKRYEESKIWYKLRFHFLKLIRSLLLLSRRFGHARIFYLRAARCLFLLFRLLALYIAAQYTHFFIFVLLEVKAILFAKS